ncbi:hypothetical protein JCM11491_002666 [Sporobolomyces phaffii]
MFCGRKPPSLATGVLISAFVVLFNSFLFGLYELLGLIFFSFDPLSWFSLLTGIVCILSAILALTGRSRESLQTLAWAFVWTAFSLGCATLMTAFLVVLQAEVSTTRETQALSIFRIMAMYFFAVLMPLSWLAYELREFAVLLSHETDPKYALRRLYDAEMDREVSRALARGTKNGAGAGDKETRSMLEPGQRKSKRGGRQTLGSGSGSGADR